MAAYGTLVSLQNLIENIQLYHAHRPDFLDEHQAQFESLRKSVTNLQDLLEWYSSRGRNDSLDMESRIVHAANVAEDTIELYIVGHIRALSFEEQIMIYPDYPLSFTNVHEMDPDFFSEELEKVVEVMDVMEKEMMKIKEKNIDGEDNQLQCIIPSASMEYSPGLNDDMVGFESEFVEIMNKLRGHALDLEIISITGMGGGGKSTLARSVWDNKSSMDQFDVRGWMIISQEFRARETLSHLLKEFSVPHEKKDDFDSLGEKLHKHLFGRRFLIVVDDVWSINDWDKLRKFLPDNSNGSRIIVTTRLMNVATDAGSSHICKISFLDEVTSWSLLCRKAFSNQACPSELQEIGKRISRKCKGLPLSLAVIGGLLGKLEKTRECWKKIAGEINMIVTSEDDERCLKILSLSYSHLPMYLKPCFLYLGIFPEDKRISAESLVDLWISEGFIKPCAASRSLEDVARNYLEDLIQRTLIYVSKTEHHGVGSKYVERVSEGAFTFASYGKIEHIRIHDLLRELALNEAHKGKLLHITLFPDPNFSDILNSERRVGFHSAKTYNLERFEMDSGKLTLSSSTSGSTVSSKEHCGTIWMETDKCLPEIENAFRTAAYLRSLICNYTMSMSEPPNFRLLRVSTNLEIKYSPKAILQLINSRNLHIGHFNGLKLSSVQLLWNLQVLFVDRFLGSRRPNPDEPATFQIWDMPLLRKLFIDCLSLPDPPQSEMNGKSDLVTNLHTISCILDFKCTEEVLRKISNIQMLHLTYADKGENGISHSASAILTVC